MRKLILPLSFLLFLGGCGILGFGGADVVATVDDYTYESGILNVTFEVTNNTGFF